MSRTPRTNIRAYDTFERIIEVAARVFAQKGFDGTSMRDIAVECEISKSLLFHHFQTKDQLYDIVTHNSSQDLLSFVEGRLSAVDDPVERIREFMLASASYFQRYRWGWIATSNAFWNDPKRQQRTERVQKRKRYELLLRSLISEAVAQGRLRDVDQAMAGRLILSSLNWMHRWYDPKKEMTPPQIAESFFDMILRGLLPDAPEPPPRP